MALSTIIRRSAPTVAARLLIGQQRALISHQCGSALLVSVNRSKKITTEDSFLVPSVSRYSYSASTALTRSSSDDSLLRVIESEINCSEESFEPDEGAPEGFPFQVNDNPGQQIVSLTREYKGEKIHIDVEPSALITGDDDSSDSDDDKDSQSSLPMVVKVSKTGAPSLEFGITAYTKEIVIDSLTVNDPDTEDQTPYEGPRFDELDENMQKGFHKFLETRGIKADATKFLHEYMVNKEHREYTIWLKNLKKFVEA
ncbi:putative mitochondrial glycoprotein [Helianthus annuus]|nr:putative mitochondrial glycoprotein [Helianthus annuus]